MPRWFSRRFPVRRHVLVLIEAAVFLSSPIPRVAPLLKIGLGAVRKKDRPCPFKVGARPVEGGGDTALMFGWMRALGRHGRENPDLGRIFPFGVPPDEHPCSRCSV